MIIDGPTSALILSILGFMATLFLYKLGNDVKKHRRKKEQLTYKERLHRASQKRFKKIPNDKKEDA